MATAKTNAVRLLDRPGIRYELRSYDVDPDDLAAETVAQKIGMSPEQVFKTLVARGDKHGVCLAVVPGNCDNFTDRPIDCGRSTAERLRRCRSCELRSIPGPAVYRP